MKTKHELYLLAITCLCALTGLVRAADKDIAVVPEPSLSKLWRAEEPEIAHLELSGAVRMQYGCANVGFIIEPNGAVSTPLRLLAYRADRTLPAWDRTIQVVSSNLRSAIPTFAPVTEGSTPGATYTSISIPFVHAKFAKSLTSEQKDQLNGALRQSCLIADLATRLTSADKTPQQLEPLAALDQLLSKTSR